MITPGHGKLGLNAPLRPFAEFIDETSGNKIILAECRGGRVVEDWANSAGDMYITAFGYSFGGFVRDVVGVRTGTDTGPGLTRVDSPAICQATPGSFYYDPAPTRGASGTWDDGGNWDVDGDVWDDVLVLYVHLEDGSNPNLTTVVAELGFYFSNVGIIHPSLSDDRLSGIGSFESWTDEDTPNDWSVTESTWAVKRDSGNYRDGTYGLRLEGSGSGSASVYKNALPLVAGGVYRLSGEYKADGDGAAFLAVTESGGSDSAALSDGRTYADAGQVDLPAPGPDWRRFSFDFIAVGSSRLRLGGSGTSGSVRFDKVRLQRVWRYVPYEARLAASSVPSSETGSNDIFFGGKRIGTGSLSLINSDGRMERLFGQLDWSGREVRTFFGGVFRDGSDILFDDYRRTFTGLVQGITAADNKVTLRLQDSRVLFNVTLPPRVYDDSIFPTMDFTHQGKARPLWFGAKEHVAPVRISLTSDGYGVYELADVTEMPDGIHSLTDVHFYENKEAADADDDSRVISNHAHPDETPNFVRTDPSFDVSSNATITAGNVQKTAGANNAWNAGARSSGTTVTTAGGNQYIEGSVGGGAADASCRGAIGLATSTADFNPNTTVLAIEYTAIGSTGAYHIWLNGVDSVTVSGIYPQRCDRMRIQYLDGVITFWVNRAMVYQTVVTLADATTYYMRAMLYTSNALIGGLAVYKESSLRHSVNLTTALLTITKDGGPYRAVAGENGFTFSHSGGTNEHLAVIPAGLYDGSDLAFVAGASMACAVNDAVGVAPHDHKGVYSETTHLITFTVGGTGAIMEVQSGTQRGAYKLLGFNGSNRALATSHVSDMVLFTSPEKNHIIHVFGTGYKDDGDGTFTGTADAPIETGADILRVLATRFMPPVLIDDASFTFARGRAPEALGIYLNKAVSTKTILDTLEFSNIANIVLDGDGTLYYLVYVGDVPDGITDFYDRDYLDFDVDSGVTDVYTGVKVLFNQNPHTGEFDARAAADPATPIRFGRPDVREFETYLTLDDNAIAYSTRILSLASTPARKIKFSARGKLTDKKVGDKIRLTRARALDPAGKLNARVVRILSISHSYQDGRSTADCVDDVVTVAGYACVSVCQASCESTCQTGCEFACQATCEEVCQDSCQVSCEGACQGGVCQTTCQLACQGACQASCQVGCQVGCQTGCEVSCQASCQLHCQFTCQVSCQQTCELACQQTCESTCQTSCELACQDACQTSCQTDCQFECQTYKQQEGGP